MRTEDADTVSHLAPIVRAGNRERRYRTSNLRSGIGEAHPCAPSGSPRRGTVCDRDRIGRILRLDLAELEKLTAVAERTEVVAGRTLFDAGRDATDAFLVLGGTLRVAKSLADGRRVIIAFAGAGDFLGIADESKYTYEVEAITYASVCRFARARLDGLLDQCPHLRSHFLHAARSELHRAQDRMLLLGCKTAMERLASFLVQHAERCRTAGLPRDTLYLPMSRGDIADHLGLTTETVSRTFTQMTRARLIELTDSRHLKLLDRAALLRETGGVVVPSG